MNAVLAEVCRYPDEHLGPPDLQLGREPRPLQPLSRQGVSEASNIL